MKTPQNFSANVGEGWVSVDAKLPQRGRYVLVARNSGYSSTPIEYLTAQLNTNYKGWTDPSNTRLTDSGPNPIYWFDGDLPLLPTPPVQAIKSSQATFLDMALACGAHLDGAPDGSKPVAVVFSPKAWQTFADENLK